jgi:hypothetical protein
MFTPKKVFEFGGYAAAAILVAFGIVALVMGINGRNEVSRDVKREYIVGSSDMTPAAIAAEAKDAKLSQQIIDTLPTCNVAGKAVNSGARAKCFADYMRIHTLESTKGLTYSQMGRFQAKADAPASATDGNGGTNDSKYAAIDPNTKQPVSNGARNLWVTETALTTALNTSFFAEQVSMFSIVIAIALILAGLGFGILSFTAFRWLPAYDASLKRAGTGAPVKAEPQAT